MLLPTRVSKCVPYLTVFATAKQRQGEQRASNKPEQLLISGVDPSCRNTQLSLVTCLRQPTKLFANLSRSYCGKSADAMFAMRWNSHIGAQGDTAMDWVKKGSLTFAAMLLLAGFSMA